MRAPTAPSHFGFARALGRLCAGSVLCLMAAGAMGQGHMEREGIVLHWGLMSAAGLSQPRAMEDLHGGRPIGGGKINHLVLALFDAKSGHRIDDAIIRAQLCEPGIVDGPAKYVPLMTVYQQASYGQLFGMVENGPYLFKVMVKLSDRPRAIEYVISAASQGPLAR